MPHVRTQIRSAAVAALTGLATTGANVFADPLTVLEAGDLPAVLVDLEDESVETLGIHQSPTQMRQPSLVVRGVVKVGSGMNALLDQIALEVETAVAAAGNFGGVLKDVPQLVRLGPLPPERLEKPVGVLEIQYAIEYHTTAGQPGTAL